jgi:phosphatidylserine decarboxylase
VNPSIELRKILADNPGWDSLLLASIKQAKEVALHNGMARAKYWPDDLSSYFDYVDRSWQVIPYQNYPRETFITLCTFYWLIDQPTGRELQEHALFNKWMNNFAKSWGSFLNTPESAKGISTFEKDPAYAMWQYVRPPGGWACFNDFFARQMKPGLRPIAGSRQDSIITSPADCTFMSKAKIDAHSNVTFKHTHTYNIIDLLEGSPYKNHFRGGLYAHSFLGPNDYHRFHAPTRGTVLECRPITGKVFLQVTIKDGEFNAPDDVDNGYEFCQQRGLIIWDSPVGLVACLPIGMAQVSSVNMNAVVGAYQNKGDEFGYFMFGGSDIILLFEKGSNIEFTAAPGVHTNVGVAVGEAIP